MDSRYKQNKIMQMPNPILFDYIDKGIREYMDFFGVGCPTRLGVTRWMSLYDKCNRLRRLMKVLNKTLRGVLVITKNLNGSTLDNESAEVLKTLDIHDIVKIKLDPGYAVRLLQTEAWLRSGKVIDILKRSIDERRIIKVNELVDMEVIRLMNEIVWELNNKKYYVVMDTETNSLPKKNTPSRGFPVQIAYAIMDQDKRVVAARNMYIQPIFPIDPGAEAIHCLSKSYLEYNGYDPLKAYQIMLEDIAPFKKRIAIAHNMPFDKGVIGRLSWFISKPLPHFDGELCTLQYFRGRKLDDPVRTRNGLMDIKNAYGIEDHVIISRVKEYFNKDIGNPHNAMFDVATLVEILKQPDVKLE